jgi:phosphate transport system substrate-binding protein
MNAKKCIKLILITTVVMLTPIIILFVYVLFRDSYYQNNEKREETRWLRELGTVGQDVDLHMYRPFFGNTQVAQLSEPSTFKLTEECELPHLDGATALYPIYSSFVRAVYPKAGYRHFIRDCNCDEGCPCDEENEIVLCTTTPVAYERLIKGGTDIIFVTGISDEHAELAEQMGVELEFTPIGKEAFVFFVNSENPVNSITSDEIRGIYSGEIQNWNEIGGVDSDIRAYQRNIGSGSQTAFLDFMEGIPVIEPAEDELIESMMGIINDTTYRNHDNAIGYSFRFFSTEMAGNNKITLLEVDGVSPTLKNIKNDTYPLVFDFYAVTVKGNPNPNIAPFIEWIKGEQGRYLIEKTGYTAY